MKLYHTTTPERAATIKSKGFLDAEGSYGLMFGDGTPFHIRGVFFSDTPLRCNDGLPPDASEVFVIEIPKYLIELYELVEEGKGYREWCIPARLVNRYFAEREPVKLDSLLWGLRGSDTR